MDAANAVDGAGGVDDASQQPLGGVLAQERVDCAADGGDARVADEKRDGKPGARVDSDPPGIGCGSDCTEVFPLGTLVTLSGTSDPGFIPTRWSGDCSGVGHTCTFTVDGPKSIGVDFGPVSFSEETDFGGDFTYGDADFGDYDSDGDLDLVIVAEGSSTLYRNDGGAFVDILEVEDGATLTIGNGNSLFLGKKTADTESTVNGELRFEGSSAVLKIQQSLETDPKRKVTIKSTDQDGGLIIADGSNNHNGVIQGSG